jgi:hypothetical protein
MDWNARVHSHLTVGEDEVIEELAQHARTEYETARAEGCSTAEADARVSVGATSDLATHAPTEMGP